MNVLRHNMLAAAAVAIATLITPSFSYALDLNIGDERYVKVQDARVQEAPHSGSSVIATLPIGATVEIYGPMDRQDVADSQWWVQVSIQKGKKIGWIRVGELMGDSPTVNPNPLAIAIRTGNLSRVRELVDAGASINVDITGSGGTEGDRGVTPLLGALMSGNAEIAKYLISRGANLNAVATLGMGEDHFTPLSVAVSKGYEDVVGLLLKKGVNRNQCVISAGGENGTPLHIAIASNRMALMRLLVVGGANLDSAGCQYGGDSGFTPLMTAVSSGNIGSVSFLLQAGANPNAIDSAGNTALSNVLGIGHHTLVKLESYSSLFNGSSGDVVEKAVLDVQRQMIRLLVEHGADVTKKGRDGKTFIEWTNDKAGSDLVDFVFCIKKKIQCP